MGFCDPYDLSTHLSEAFYANLRSAKWSERKDAIQEIINIAEKSPILAPSNVLHNLISELSGILAKDNNINVAACAALLLAKLALGAPSLFRSAAPSVILICLTRMKDTKPVIKNACSDCLDAAYSSTTFSEILGPVKAGLVLTAPGSKIQACEFFTRIMLRIDFPTAKASAAATKELVDQLCKLAIDPNPDCREASMRSLAAFMRAVTKQIAIPLLPLVAEDKLKMAKIEENYDQFIVEFPFDDGKKKVETVPVPSLNEVSAKPISNETGPVDARLSATPYNITRHLNKNFYTNLRSAKWSERKDAIQEIINIAEKNPVFSPSDELHDLINEFSKILANDSNINVAACAALALGKIAYGAGETFKNSAPSVIQLCLNRSKDTKPVIKNACSECLDRTYSVTTYANVAGPIKEGLAMTAPGSKIQTCEFFTRIMLKIDFSGVRQAIVPTKEIVDQLCKLALGADTACREASMKALAAFMRAVGKPMASPLLAIVAVDKLKMFKIEEYYENFTAEFPNDTVTTTNGHLVNDIPIGRPMTANASRPKPAPPRQSSAPPRKSMAPKSVPVLMSPKKPVVVTNRAPPPRLSSAPSKKPPAPKPAVVSSRPSIVSAKPASRPVSSRPVVVSATPRKPPIMQQQHQTVISQPKEVPTSHPGRRSYGVLRPKTVQDDRLNVERGTTPKRSMLRPPLTVFRPARSIDNLAEQ